MGKRNGSVLMVDFRDLKKMHLDGQEKRISTNGRLPRFANGAVREKGSVRLVDFRDLKKGHLDGQEKRISTNGRLPRFEKETL